MGRGAGGKSVNSQEVGGAGAAGEAGEAGEDEGANC